MGRDDIIGYLLLGFCVVVGGTLVFSIVTGQRFQFTGPPWAGTALAIIFFGAVIYSLVLTLRRRWPDPRTGQGWRWPWSKDRDDPPAGR